MNRSGNGGGCCIGAEQTLCVTHQVEALFKPKIPPFSKWDRDKIWHVLSFYSAWSWPPTWNYDVKS